MKNKSGFARLKNHSHGEHGHNLTSLVDCFAIILVYLLMATAIGEVDLDIPKGMVLPKASEAKSLTEQLIVMVKDRTYEIAGRPILLQNLAQELKRLSDEKGDLPPEKKALVIQTDKSTPWSDINPVVVSGLQAGFSEVQFAVLKEEKM